MNKLTSEEIAKVFAMYLHNEVMGSYDDGDRKAYLTGVHGENEAELQFFEEDGINVMEQPEYNAYSNCKLILTPLSNLSAEHEKERTSLVIENEGDAIGYAYMYQYLLSKGYAVPLFFGINHWANGKTAIELGIANPIHPHQ